MYIHVLFDLSRKIHRSQILWIPTRTPFERALNQSVYCCQRDLKQDSPGLVGVPHVLEDLGADHQLYHLRFDHLVGLVDIEVVGFPQLVADNLRQPGRALVSERARNDPSKASQCWRALGIALEPMRGPAYPTSPIQRDSGKYLIKG